MTVPNRRKSEHSLGRARGRAAYVEAALERAGKRFFRDPKVQEILETSPEALRIMREVLRRQDQEEATQVAEAG